MEETNGSTPKKTLDVDAMAKENWKYVEGILKAHGQTPDLIKIIKFHYLTAYEHGFFRAAEELAAIYASGDNESSDAFFEGMGNDLTN